MSKKIKFILLYITFIFLILLCSCALFNKNNYDYEVEYINYNYNNVYYLFELDYSVQNNCNSDLVVIPKSFKINDFNSTNIYYKWEVIEPNKKCYSSIFWMDDPHLYTDDVEIIILFDVYDSEKNIIID